MIKPFTLWLPWNSYPHPCPCFVSRKCNCPCLPPWSPRFSWFQEQLRSKLTDSFWFAWDFPSFSIESPMSQKAHPSQANQKRPPCPQFLCAQSHCPCPGGPPTTHLTPSANVCHHPLTPSPRTSQATSVLKLRSEDSSWPPEVFPPWMDSIFSLSVFSSSLQIAQLPRKILVVNRWGFGSCPAQAPLTLAEPKPWIRAIYCLPLPCRQLARRFVLA